MKRLKGGLMMLLSLNEQVGGQRTDVSGTESHLTVSVCGHFCKHRLLLWGTVAT